MNAFIHEISHRKIKPPERVYFQDNVIRLEKSDSPISVVSLRSVVATQDYNKSAESLISQSHMFIHTALKKNPRNWWCCGISRLIC